MPGEATIEFEVYCHTTAIVVLGGEHDLSSAPELARVLAEAADRRDLLVDLSACTFMDSSIISALLHASGRLHKRGSLFTLVIPPGRHDALRNLFELMDIQKLLPTHATRAAAIEYLERAQPVIDAPTARLRAFSEILDTSLPDVDEQRRAS
jgi:anti-anti-sigma factor